jgi:LysM repeat protein
MSKIYFILFVLMHGSFIAFSSELQDEKLNQCKALISNGDYKKAEPILEELILEDHNTSESEYLLAICYTANPSKINKAIKLLESSLATASVGDEIEIQILLSRYYHQNYQFDDAIAIYEQLDTAQAIGKIKSVMSLFRLMEDYKVLIEQCNTAKKLMESLTVLELKVAKNLLKRQFISSYRKIVGTELWKSRSYSIKSKTMYSVEDAKEDGEMFSHQVGLASARLYPENLLNKFGRRHKDLVYEVKEKGSEWFDRIYVGNLVNSDWDEDYPFLSLDSNTLYFSSNGKESMGGYDIFKSERDTATGYWGKAINLGFPVNTPYDEVMYMKDEAKSRAYFSSNRFSGTQSFDLFEWSINENEQIPYSFIINRKVGNDTTIISDINISNYNNSSFSSSITLVDNDSKYLLMVNQLERYVMDVQLSNGERFSSDVFSLSPQVYVGSSFTINYEDSTYALKKKNITTGKRDSKMLKLLLSSSFGRDNDTIAPSSVQSIVLSDSLNLDLLQNQYKIVSSVLNEKEVLWSKLHRKIEERIGNMAGWMKFKGAEHNGGSKQHTEAEKNLNYLVIEIQSLNDLQKELAILQDEEKILRRIQLLNNLVSETDAVDINSRKINQLYKGFAFSFDSLKEVQQVISKQKGNYYYSLIQLKDRIEVDKKAVENYNLTLDSKLALFNEELNEAQRQQDNSWWKRKKRRLQKIIDSINSDIQNVDQVVSENNISKQKRALSIELITMIFEVGDYRYVLPDLSRNKRANSSIIDLGYLGTLLSYQKGVVEGLSDNDSSFFLPFVIVNEISPGIIDSVWQVEENNLRSVVEGLSKKFNKKEVDEKQVVKGKVNLNDSSLVGVVAEAITKDKKEKALSLVQHSVKSGETIYYLARLYNVSVKEVKRWNEKTNSDTTGIDWKSKRRSGEHRNWLYVGEKIKIYKKPEVKIHKVKSLESLRIIAVQYKMSKKELKELNTLGPNQPKGVDWESPRRSGSKFEWLYVGESLIVK